MKKTAVLQLLKSIWLWSSSVIKIAKWNTTELISNGDMFQPHLKYTLKCFHTCTSRSRYLIITLFHSSVHFFSVLVKGFYQTESYSLHVMLLIFLFSTPCGVGSLLCMRNINCKPHWLAMCCLSRIFYFFLDRQFRS
jgi:hypothetical protein